MKKQERGRARKRIIIVIVSLLLVCAAFSVGVNVYMTSSYKKLTDTAPDGEKFDCILILGAKVFESGGVSAMLADRLDRGIELYFAGVSDRILVSGDHGRTEYDEVNTMKAYCVERGVPSEAVFMDHAGFSTYETMYRARDVFCVKDAVIVTQRFHLYRSLYIAKKLGINAVGYDAPELNRFRKALHLKWEIRESLARVKTFFLVLFNAQPTYLGEEIPITGSGYKTWD